MNIFFKTALTASMALMVALSSPSVSANSISVSLRGSSAALGEMVVGSEKFVRGGMRFSLVSISAVAGGSLVVLKSLATGAQASLKVTGESVGAVSKFAGKTLETVVTASGTIFKAGTDVALFIPSTSVRKLFHSTSYGEYK